MPSAKRELDGGRDGVRDPAPAAAPAAAPVDGGDGPSRPVARLVGALPVAFVVLLALMTGLAQAAAVLGLRPLSSWWGSSALLVLTMVPAVVLARAVSRRIDVDLLGLAPAGLLAGYGVVAWLLPDGRRVEWFLGGDHVRHLVFAAEEAAAGRLSYEEQTYPRAWHTLVAALWRAGGGREDAAGLSSLVDLMASLSWLLPVLLAVATATATTAVARAVGLHRRAAAWASLAAATALLVPTFLANYQAMGFENSYVVAVVTAVVGREVLVRSGGLEPVLVCAAGAVVCAHAWQLLLPGVGLALLVVSLRAVRSRVGPAPVAAIWLVGLAAAAPALAALVSEIGLDHATDSDVEAPYSVVLLAAALVAAVGLAAARRDARLWSFAALVALPSLTAVGLVLAVGVGPGDYYPSKLFWHSGTLGLPAAAVAAAVLGERVTPAMSPALRRVATVVAGGAAGLVALYAAASPLGAFLGAWSTVDGEEVLDAITAPDAAAAQVVWLGDRGDDTIGRILLDFYRAGETSDRTPQPPLTVAEECAVLRGADRPAVLSDRPETAVRSRYGCEPELRVVPVR